MENIEERKDRKSKTKAFIGSVLVLLVIGGGYVTYTQGLIPGFGGGQKVADELKADIEALKGPNIKTKLASLYQESGAPQTDLERFQELMGMFQMDFQYSDLKATGGQGVGTVEVNSPRLSITSAQGSNPGDIVAQKLIVSRSVSDVNHYFFHTEGDLEFHGEVNGTKTKLFAISGEEPANELKYSKNGDYYYKSTAKNLQFKEGRGNTTFFTVGEAYNEGSQKKEGELYDAWAKLSYKNIVAGDMIKMMIGNLEPISVNADYSYKGENYQRALSPDYYISEDPFKEVKPFDGELKLSDLSILIGPDAGLKIVGDAKFTKASNTAIPIGTAVVSVLQYEKLIEILKRLMPIPQGEIDKMTAFLTEIGTNNNGNIEVSIKFDGTENVLIGGKTVDEVKVIHDKHFPMPEGVLPEGAIPPQPEVQSSPLPVDPSAPVAAAPVTPPQAVTPSPTVPAPTTAPEPAATTPTTTPKTK